MTHDIAEEHQVALIALKGKKVNVWIGRGPRASFNVQVSVCGLLEQNDNEPDRWRVLIDEGTYAYFEAWDVQTCRKPGTSSGTAAWRASASRR
jgi:hypothetical protein